VRPGLAQVYRPPQWSKTMECTDFCANVHSNLCVAKDKSRISNGYSLAKVRFQRAFRGWKEKMAGRARDSRPVKTRVKACIPARGKGFRGEEWDRESGSASVHRFLCTGTEIPDRTRPVKGGRSGRFRGVVHPLRDHPGHAPGGVGHVPVPPGDQVNVHVQRCRTACRSRGHPRDSAAWR
jgi:hypothetical protein